MRTKKEKINITTMMMTMTKNALGGVIVISYSTLSNIIREPVRFSVKPGIFHHPMN